jgi:hypothetical protein
VLQQAQVVSNLKRAIIVGEGFLGKMFFQVFLLSCKLICSGLCFESCYYGG